jgi:hypothetical protein
MPRLRDGVAGMTRSSPAATGAASAHLSSARRACESGRALGAERALAGAAERAGPRHGFADKTPSG